MGIPRSIERGFANTSVYRTLIRIGPVLISLMLLLSLLWPATAGAHSVLLQTNPSPQERVAESPATIVMEFNEAVQAPERSIRLFNPSSQEITGLEPRTEGNKLIADIPELKDEGSYTVAWQAISADSHVIRGTYLFHFRSATLTEPVDVQEIQIPLWARSLRSIGIAVTILALITLWSGWLLRIADRRAFQQSNGDDDLNDLDNDGNDDNDDNGADAAAHDELATVSGLASMRSTQISWIGLIIGAVVAYSGAVLGIGTNVSANFSTIAATITGKFGLAVVGIAVAGALISLMTPVYRRLELLLLLGVAGTVISQGHAVSIPPVWVSWVMTAAHVVAIIVWAVGLIWLDRELRRAADRSADQPSTDEVDRRSRAVDRLALPSTISVVVIAISGLWLYVTRVDIDEMFLTSYGIVGLGKVALTVILVGLGGYHRFIIRPRLKEDTIFGDSLVLNAFRRSLRTEMLILVATVVLGAVLAQIAPVSVAERAANEQGMRRRGLVEREVEFGHGKLGITIEPARRGTVEIHIYAFEDAGILMGDIGELELQLYLPEEDIGPLEPTMQEISTGHTLSYTQIPFEGTWEFHIGTSYQRFERYETVIEIDIQG